MTNEQDPLDGLLHNLVHGIPLTKEQAKEAVSIEFQDLQEHFGLGYAQQLYLTVLMNSYVDRSFSSEEYTILQNERMIKLAAIFNTLLQIFYKDPQSFTGNAEILRVALPEASTPNLSLVCNNVEALVNVPSVVNRIPLHS